MDRFDHRAERPGSTDAQERGSGESQQAAEERVRALEEALGRLLAVSPSPAQLESGVHGEAGAAAYVAAYERARRVAQEALGPYQLHLGLPRTQAELAPGLVGNEHPRRPSFQEVHQFLERGPELER